ncbi:MAG: ABC transporter ATP-binding protein [Aestuariivirga sp.]|uniref:ABC transporter ATP-binding protein n=1 Tax=Aestuariivirga sp. TaxID=2650926 RepID=UPI0038CF3928
MAELSLKGVRKSFGDVHVIKGVDLDIAHGEFIVFVGPSGCGKSTLLRLIAGLEEATSGVIAIGGKVVNGLPPKDRSIAMVFQSYALFPHMTVYDNVGFGLRIAGEAPGAIDKKVREAARILKMEELLDRKPSQLSGGQRQRVAIGRAIVRNPEVFLFDEPLSNLDAALRVSTRAEIAKLHRDLCATMIYVTHDQVEAMTLADKIAVLDGGVVQQFGPPLELYRQPRNMFVAGFIGSPRMNFLPVRVVSRGAGTVTLESPVVGVMEIPAAAEGVSLGGQLTLGIRPEHIRRSAPGEGRVVGQVELVELLGAQTTLEVRAGPATVSAVLAGTETPRTGDTVSLDFSAGDCHLFGEDGNALRASGPAVI